MKIKLSTLLLTLALIAACLCACFPVTGDNGYRTMPVGTGTEAPVFLETEPGTVPVTISGDVTTLTPEITEDPSVSGDETTAQSPDITTSAPDSGDAETTAPAPDISAFEFNVIEESEEIGTVGKDKCLRVLRYPALKGLEDTDTQEKINKLLSQIAAVEYQNRLPNATELTKDGTYVSYEITDTAVTFVGNDLASIRSEGKIDYKDDAKDECFVYCNLIKLSTGKDITLKKTYTDFGTIMTLFSSGKFKQISGDSSLTSSISLSHLIEQYKYYSQYGTYPETYFTKDSLVLVIETNVESSFFAEFSIDLSEVNGCLAESPTK